MSRSWTDNPATSSTHIRAVHVNELRRAVDTYRAQIGLGPYGWTDNPINSTVHIRAVHFTELKSAIQDLWNYHDQGTLPNWSVGTDPSSGRQISARDMNDLRTWVDETDPPPPVVGANVNPDQSIYYPGTAPSPSILAAAHINGVRLVSRTTDVDLNSISATLSAGIVVLAIVAINDPQEMIPTDTRVVLQIGNEPDVSGAGYLSASDYADRWAMYRGTYPGYTMFMAGLATGQPSYYGDFLDAMATNHPEVDLPAVVDLHIYNKYASDVPDYFASFTDQNPAIPATCTEWQPNGDPSDPDYSTIVPLQQALGDPADPDGVAITWNSWFPWCTAMNPDLTFPGVVDGSGNGTDVCSTLIGYLDGACP